MSTHKSIVVLLEYLRLVTYGVVGLGYPPLGKVAMVDLA